MKRPMHSFASSALLLSLASSLVSRTATAQSTTSSVLSEPVVGYMDVVAQLQTVASDPNLGNALSDATQKVGFSSLANFWESPAQVVSAILYLDQTSTPSPNSDFAQAVVGRKDNTCYGVFKGLSDDGSWANSGLTKSKTRISADGVQRYGCAGISVEVCQCQAHVDFLTDNFPTQTEYIVGRLSSCMSDCGSNCDLVLGGHGQGGAVAQLLAFRFVPQNPYVLASGAPMIMYDPDCSGFDMDRFIRFVGVRELSSPTLNDNGSSVGICFDDVPFVASDMLYSYGHTIGIFETTESIQFTEIDMLNDATRPTCRQAHSVDSYNSELMDAYLVYPNGVPEEDANGFASGEPCTVDGDCRATMSCGDAKGSGGFLHCMDDSNNQLTETTTPVATPTGTPATPAPTKTPTTDAPATAPPTTAPQTQTTTTTTTTTPSPTQAPVTRAPVTVPLTGAPTFLATEAANAQGVGQPDFVPEDDTLETEPTDFTPHQVVGIHPAPTLQPSQAPLTPNQVPTTSGPSDLTQRSGFYQITLVLMDVTSKLEGYSNFVWERETDGHIQEWIVGYADLWKMTEVRDVQVSTNIVKQTLGYMGPVSSVTAPKARHGGSRRRRVRVLQSNNDVATPVPSDSNPVNALEIVFDVAVYYHTTLSEDLDLMVLILQAFQSERGRSEYVARLVDSNDAAYKNLQYFSVKLSGYDGAGSGSDGLQAAEGTKLDNNSPSVLIWVIIGATMGALALVLMVGYVVYLQRQQQKLQKDTHAKLSKGTTKETVAPSALAMFEPAYLEGGDGPANRLESEIIVRKFDDDGVSTLGDPIMYTGQQVMYADDPTSTSYTQNYLGNGHGISANARERIMTEDSTDVTTTVQQPQLRQTSFKEASVLSMVNEASMLSSNDNDSFEEIFGGQDECFEVVAPPGKLGMVIDVTKYGEPVVRAIKDDSVLANKVKVHDLIISVDGQGCTDMSAMQVSKLLSVKSSNPSRKIVFSRPTDSILCEFE